MFSKSGPEISSTLAMVSPGAPLRGGLDRVLQARMGALVVVGDGPDILSICTGGFLLDTEYSPQRMYELAKMDGAIILSSDAKRIARANVHLMPDPKVHTTETGTRHRTAERVARSLDVPVLTVSEEQSVITIYRGSNKKSLASTAALLSKSNQALATLERYKMRLDEVLTRLDFLEDQQMVHFSDIVLVLQRYEMVRRITEEIEVSLLELGDDGRLVSLQLNELSSGFEFDYRSVVEDYLGACSIQEADSVIGYLGSIGADELLAVEIVAKGLLADPLCAKVWGASARLSTKDSRPDTGQTASRGMRALARAHEVPLDVRSSLLDGLPPGRSLSDMTIEELLAIDGVPEQWAHVIAEIFNMRASSPQ